MKAAYLSMLTEDDCLTFGETALDLFRSSKDFFYNSLIPSEKGIINCGDDKTVASLCVDQGNNYASSRAEPVIKHT